MRTQFRAMSGRVTWVGWIIAPIENAHVTSKNIANINPAENRNRSQNNNFEDQK